MNGSNTMNSLVNSGSIPLRKRRPIGRKRRNVFEIRNFNDTVLIPDLNSLNPDPRDMYFAMINCAENYTKFFMIEQL